MTTTTGYIFDNAWQQERQRLASLEAVYDPGTFRVLAGRGVGEGWHCLEIGGGGGSVARWLGERVGMSGSVLATDLDTRFLDAIGAANVEVRRHDITVDPLPAGAFDLIHMRMVLQHLPERPAVLRRLVGALRPGGWLVSEDMDFVTAVADPRVGPAAAALFGRLMRLSVQTAAARGADLLFGRALPGELQAAGLAAVGEEGRATIWRGGSPGATAWRLSIEQRRGWHVETGEITDAEIDAGLAMLGDPAFAAVSPLMMASWGRRAD